MTLRRIRRRVREGRVEFTSHALEEMDDDFLSVADVLTLLQQGEVVARLSDDERGARYVVRGEAAEQGVAVEVVCRLLPSGVLRIVTVYAVAH